jgi:hypothetical protein
LTLSLFSSLQYTFLLFNDLRKITGVFAQVHCCNSWNGRNVDLHVCDMGIRTL